LYRIAKQDIDLSDKSLRANDLIYWVMSSANRDPRAFPDPDTFDITRSPNPHVSFGGGVHHCLAAALARIEAQEAFRHLAERIPRFLLQSDTFEYVPDLFSRQLVALRVAW
jgi:pimeloyl-[acyl-carrier protein] synthase